MQIDTLQRKIDETQAVCRSLKQRSSSYAMQRGVLILIALLALFRGYYYEQLFYALCVLSLGLFLYIAAKHRALKQRIEDHEVMMEVLQDVLRRKNNGWKAFQDTGSEFLQEENTQAYDLDLFGDASLYQYLCVAKTYTEENDWQSFSVHSSSPAKRCKAAVLPYRNAPERRHSPLP